MQEMNQNQSRYESFQRESPESSESPEERAFEEKLPKAESPKGVYRSDTIYGNHLPELEETMDFVLRRIDAIRKQLAGSSQQGDPVDHVLSRIKTDASMREKCRRKGIPENEHSALEICQDAIGIRIICPFLNDVYTIANALKAQPDFESVEEKDYIRHVKPNGYRSLHIIMRIHGLFVEFQIRTISMDTWAALEHLMTYKQNISGNEKLIVSELKRCADELASTDVSMQTIRDMITTEGDGGEPPAEK